jgi:sialidase-1
VALKSGQMLAFAEGRVNNSGDFGDIDIVLKTSRDKGNSWSALKILVDYDSIQAGNPAPVVDDQDPEHPSGVVYLFYNTGNNHEGEVRKGKGLRQVWFIRSFDQGLSWSAPVNITKQTHRPNQPNENPDYQFSDDWRAYANTPGHAFQFKKGNYAGRIFVAANHSFGAPQEHYKDCKAHGFYTDDHGKTFHLAATVDTPGTNEVMATELSNSRMLMTIRNQRGDIRSRVLAYSSTGGESWDTVYFENALPDPVCQGAILTLGYKKGKAILAHCNAGSQQRRDNLTIRISYDEGKTWPYSKVVDASADQRQRNWTAYSDLVAVDAKTLGVLYERDNYSQIVFKTSIGSASTPMQQLQLLGKPTFSCNLDLTIRVTAREVL